MLQWRDNLHNLIAYLLYDNDKRKIPAAIIDAIDSAYLQGLEEKEIHENKSSQQNG